MKFLTFTKQIGGLDPTTVHKSILDLGAHYEYCKLKMLPKIFNTNLQQNQNFNVWQNLSLITSCISTSLTGECISRRCQFSHTLYTKFLFGVQQGSLKGRRPCSFPFVKAFFKGQIGNCKSGKWEQ